MPPPDYLILAPADRVLDDDNYRSDTYSEAELRLLAESINDHGLVHRPVALELPDGFFRLICGHRRKHAMVDILHWDSIPLEVRFLTAAQASDPTDLTADFEVRFLAGSQSGDPTDPTADQ